MNEFLRIQMIMNSKTLSIQKKELVDQNRWKNKFRAFLEKEKILSFDSQESSQIFLKKGIMT
jgi:hypothetical protein